MTDTKTNVHINLSTDQLASLEINGTVSVPNGAIDMIVVRADELDVSVAELANPFGDVVATGNGYTVSA